MEATSPTRRLATFQRESCQSHSLHLPETNKIDRDDVNELMSLINTLRGFPSHQSKDLYCLDTRVDFNTFEIQWSNQDDDPAANEIQTIEQEQKDDFKRIADSIEALARTFAKKDSAL